MNTKSVIRVFGPIVLAAWIGACASHNPPTSSNVSMTGAQEVPPAATSATGAGQITVNPQRVVSGTVTVYGMNANAAHIHTGGPGVSGPPIITLTETTDNTFTIPAGSVLTEEQYARYRAGDLYINVHSPSYPGGEVRAQLKPQGGAGSMGSAGEGGSGGY
jgi:hypothetical protein